jgi:hypothetical protein
MSIKPKSVTETVSQYGHASFGIKTTTSQAPDGSRFKKPMSVVHMENIRRRRVKKDR